MKIGNINRKLMAGILAIALTTTGCTMSHGIPTETTDRGEVVYSTVEFNDIRNWKVIILDVDGENEFYIAKKATSYSGSVRATVYRNVFDNQVLKMILRPSIAKSNIISEVDLLSYLVIYDKIQSEYTEEELKEILEQIKADFELQEEKIKELDINN